MQLTSQYKANLERSQAKVLDLKTCIEAQKLQITQACDKMLADHRAGKPVAEEIQYWQKRSESLKGYFNSISAELDHQKELMDKELDRMEQAVRAEYQQMRGLTSYALASGQGSPELQLLHDSLGDVLDAKNGRDREDARKTVDLSLKFAKFGNEVEQPDNSILGQYESIGDPADSTAFYREHEAEIQGQFQARLDGNKLN